MTAVVVANDATSSTAANHDGLEDDVVETSAATTTTTIDCEEQEPPNVLSSPKERFLERFPFQEGELDEVLAAFDRFHNESEHEDTATPSNSTPPTPLRQQQQKQHLLLSDLVKTLHNHNNNDEASTATTLDDHHYELWVKHVEEQIVSHTISQALVQVALESVVLWCVDENEDESSQKQQRWLEAVATLLGRRGPRSLLSIFFRVAVQLDQQQRQQQTDSNPLSSSSYSSPSGEDQQQKQQECGENNMADASTLADLIHRWIAASCYLRDYDPNFLENNNKTLQFDPQPPKSWIASLSRGLSHDSNTTGSTSNQNAKVDLSTWMDFANWTAPQVAATLSSYCHLSWFGPNRPFRGGASVPFQLPQCAADGGSAIWNRNNDDVTMSLGLLGLGGDWRRLYSTDLDGFHFSVMLQALQSYHGKTALLIQSTSGAVFGYYTECPWKVSQSWYGAQSDSFLFRLAPVLDMYGRTEEQQPPQDHHLHRGGGGRPASSPHAMYLNPSPVANRTRKADEALSGLAIGGIADHMPRLYLNKALENCRACTTDRTYRPGPLLEDDNAIFFDIDVLELWAIQVSDDHAFAAGCELGKKQIAIQEALRVKVAKVADRTPFLTDFESDEYNIRSKIYAHRDEVRGRHEFVAHNGSGHGYFVEDHPPSVRHNSVSSNHNNNDNEE